MIKGHPFDGMTCTVPESWVKKEGEKMVSARIGDLTAVRAPPPVDLPSAAKCLPQKKTE